MPVATLGTTIDVRTIAPRERHAAIFATFAGLAVGDALEIVNDHDPKPLYYQFAAELPDTFSWQYVESGPEVWRVTLRKVANTPGASGCCGGCGGAA